MFSIAGEEKRIKTAILLIEIGFIIVSLIFVLKVGNSTLLGSLEKFDNDDVKYVRSAWTLVEKGMLTYENVKEPTVFIMPGLSFSLAFFVILFGKFNALVAFRIFQILLQCGSLYILFLIGRKAFGSKIALLACLINAIYTVELYASSLILMECIFKFLLLLLIYLSIHAIETKNVKTYLWAAVVWALACYFKPTIAAYPAIVLFMWVRDKNYKLLDMLKYTGIVLSVFVLLMSPWWIRNYVEFKAFIPLTEAGGNPFLQGTFINYDRTEGWGVPFSKSSNSIENNKIQMEVGMERLKKFAVKEPLRYLNWYTFGKAAYFWKAPFFWFDSVLRPIAFVEHILILLTAIWGIILSFRHKKKNMSQAYILVTLLFITLSYLPFFTFGRYAYPLMPLVMLFSAFAINTVFVQMRNRSLSNL